MSDTQKQALMRFVSGLIAAVIGIAIAALQSPEFSALVGTFFSGSGLLTGLILAAIPPIVLFLGKLQAGATQKAPTVGGDVRGGKAKSERVVEGESPGLFG